MVLLVMAFVYNSVGIGDGMNGGDVLGCVVLQ